MEAYYSSDEEIAWGPVTLREIKGDLKRPRKKPDRRHTILCNFQKKDMDKAPETYLTEEVNKLNISGTSTAYYSPNETVRPNSNSDFLEKLSEVINVPSSELSNYGSVVEHSRNSDNQFEDALNESEPPRASNMFVPTIKISDYDESCANFIKAFENRNTHYDIERFQQTLVENSFVPSEDEEKVTCEEDVENTSLTQEVPVIVISDDEDNSLLADIDTEILGSDKNISMKENGNFTICKKEFIEENEPTCDGDVEKNDFNDSALSEEQLYIDEPDCDADTEFNDSVDTDEGNEYETETSFYTTPHIQHRLSTVKESLSTSPVVVPEIDLTQFDDSICKDEPLQLNDTLEEMNRLLSQGLDYSMPDEDIIENTPAKRAPSPKTFFTPTNVISSAKQPSSDTKPTTSHIPIKKLTPKSTEKFLKCTVNKISPKSNFKVPVTPLRPKLVNPTTPKSNLNLKNIVSPVGLYIKSSPRMPLMQNVPQRDLPRIVNKSVKLQNKENWTNIVFPEVMYKPSKKQILSTEKHIVIPRYLRKLKITECQITKHEGRINHKLEGSEVSKKLLQTDITNSSIDQSLLNSTGDTSVLTSKQAFVK